jgi:hypothetical protein
LGGSLTFWPSLAWFYLILTLCFASPTEIRFSRTRTSIITITRARPANAVIIAYVVGIIPDGGMGVIVQVGRRMGVCIWVKCL